MLGLPGLRVNGPIFVTEEPLREYNFSFRLVNAVDSTVSDRAGFTSFLFNDLFLLYVSGLAEQVNLPNEEFQLGQVQLSILQIPFPKSWSIPTFSVQYLEDEIMSVARFHMVWQNSIRGVLSSGGASDADQIKNVSIVSAEGLSFSELGKVCCGAIYAPSKRLPAPTLNIGIGHIAPPVDVPLGGEVFPHIFPTTIARNAGNRAGQNLSKTTITYARITDISSFSANVHDSKMIDYEPIDRR